MFFCRFRINVRHQQIVAPISLHDQLSYFVSFRDFFFACFTQPDQGIQWIAIMHQDGVVTHSHHDDFACIRHD